MPLGKQVDHMHFRGAAAAGLWKAQKLCENPQNPTSILNHPNTWVVNAGYCHPGVKEKILSGNIYGINK